MSNANEAMKRSRRRQEIDNCVEEGLNKLLNVGETKKYIERREMFEEYKGVRSLTLKLEKKLISYFGKRTMGRKETYLVVSKQGINSIPPNLEKVRKEKLHKDGDRCNVCGVKGKKIHIHHINEDRWDNRRENLQVVCIQCHRDEHVKLKEVKKVIKKVVKVKVEQLSIKEILNLRYKDKEEKG